MTTERFYDCSFLGDSDVTRGRLTGYVAAKFAALPRRVYRLGHGRFKGMGTYTDPAADVEKYPTMTFASTSIVAKSATSFDVTGNLTIKNVTKPVTFAVDVEGIIPDPQGTLHAST